MESWHTNEETFISREVRYALKDSAANELVTITEETVDDILRKLLPIAQRTIDRSRKA